MIYSELQNVLSSKTIHLKSGQHLFTQGDAVKNIYYVKKVELNWYVTPLRARRF